MTLFWPLTCAQIIVPTQPTFRYANFPCGPCRLSPTLTSSSFLHRHSSGVTCRSARHLWWSRPLILSSLSLFFGAEARPCKGSASSLCVTTQKACERLPARLPSGMNGLLSQVLIADTHSDEPLNSSHALCQNPLLVTHCLLHTGWPLFPSVEAASFIILFERNEDM